MLGVANFDRALRTRLWTNNLQTTPWNRSEVAEKPAST